MRPADTGEDFAGGVKAGAQLERDVEVDEFVPEAEG